MEKMAKRRREGGGEEGRDDDETEEEQELIYLSEGTRPNTPLIFTGVRDEGIDFAGPAGNWPFQPFDAVETGMCSTEYLSLSPSPLLLLSLLEPPLSPLNPPTSAAAATTTTTTTQPQSATSSRTSRAFTWKTQRR